MSQKIFKIFSKYQGQVEEIDATKGESSAKYLRSQYQLDHKDWEVWAEDTDGNKLQ